MIPFEKNKIKLQFNNIDLIEEYYSQAAQDIFVLSCLDGKTNGTYLDLGCRHPIEINNTFLLETKFNWKGVSVDIDEYYIRQHKIRDNVSLCLDATKLDFKKIIELLGTNHIDYLSLDLEPADITDKCLKSIPFKEIEFSLITYEHDEYRFGENYKLESRKLLESYGYKRINSSIANFDDDGILYPYEDWYYNPKYVSYDRIKCLISKDYSTWKEILFND